MGSLVSLPTVNSLAVSMSDNLQQVQPMKTPGGTTMRLEFVLGLHKDPPGTFGHSFLYGWFIVNEEGDFVYLNSNHGEYMRLIKKYRSK